VVLADFPNPDQGIPLSVSLRLTLRDPPQRLSQDPLFWDSVGPRTALPFFQLLHFVSSFCSPHFTVASTFKPPRKLFFKERGR